MSSPTTPKASSPTNQNKNTTNDENNITISSPNPSSSPPLLSPPTNWITYPTTPLLSSHYPATIYHSPITNLRFLLVTTPEPLSNVHIILSTESKTTSWYHKDDGLPHCLEHLIFLGSEQYPYKGILDKLANRSLANGTNAWTDTDNTVYTLTTAGSEGALNFLPIYADHILFPTITKSGFVTEIHHVDDNGCDNGVVYCEMQGRETTEVSLVSDAMRNLMFPSSHCGYAAETGGKMANLRKLTHEQVLRYHTENYTADNVLFVLSGNITECEFVVARDAIEKRVRERQGGWRTRDGEGRPWSEVVIPPLDESSVGIVHPPSSSSSSSQNATNNNIPLTISFPSEDESRGMILLSWRGPTYADRQSDFSLSLLWRYLTDSAASPLQRSLVECDDPICAAVYEDMEVKGKVGIVELYISEVEDGRYEEALKRFWETLRSVVEGEGDDGFDMVRMHTVIRRARRQLLELAERAPTSLFIDDIIRHFMYGRRDDDVGIEKEMEELKADTDYLPFFTAALTWTKDHWITILSKYLLNQPCGIVIGKPSASLSEQMTIQEKQREETQAKELGEAKLKKLGEELKRAMEFNEREIPPEVLTSIPVPSLDAVKSMPLLTLRGAGWDVNVAKNSGCGIPPTDTQVILERLRSNVGDDGSTNTTLYTDWNHIASAFLYLSIGLSTKSLTTRQRLYLPLFTELAFKLPATLDDGTTLSKDDVVKQLEEDTVHYGALIGSRGRVPQLVTLQLQLESHPPEEEHATGYSKALSWMRRILYQTNITIEHVKMGMQRLLSEIPPQMRDGPTVAASIMTELSHDPMVSNTLARGPLRQKPFLSELIQRLEDAEDEEEDERQQEIVNDLEELKRVLLQPQNMQIFIAGDLLKIPHDAVSQLHNALLLNPSSSTNPTAGRQLSNLSTSSILLPPPPPQNSGRAILSPLSSIESSYLTLTSPHISQIHPQSPSLPSLLVAIEYLTSLEGDFWVNLRGAGLTYSYSLSYSADSQSLSFRLYRCGNVAGALAATIQILVDYANGVNVVKDVDLENAKSSLAYSIISATGDLLSAAQEACLGSYEGGKAVNYDKWLLGEVGRVTVEEVTCVMRRYVLPLFDTGGDVVVCCPKKEAEGVEEYLRGRGWSDCRVVEEDMLCQAFVGDEEERGCKMAIPETKPGVSMFLPGAFAAQFRCGCPKCGKPESK